MANSDITTTEQSFPMTEERRRLALNAAIEAESLANAMLQLVNANDGESNVEMSCLRGGMLRARHLAAVTMYALDHESEETLDEAHKTFYGFPRA